MYSGKRKRVKREEEGFAVEQAPPMQIAGVEFRELIHSIQQLTEELKPSAEKQVKKFPNQMQIGYEGPLFFDSSEYPDQLSHDFTAPVSLNLDPDSSYKVELKFMTIPVSWHNISAEFGNNKFYYSFFGSAIGTMTHTGGVTTITTRQNHGKVATNTMEMNDILDQAWNYLPNIASVTILASPAPTATTFAFNDPAAWSALPAWASTTGQGGFCRDTTPGSRIVRNEILTFPDSNKDVTDISNFVSDDMETKGYFTYLENSGATTFWLAFRIDGTIGKVGIFLTSAGLMEVDLRDVQAPDNLRNLLGFNSQLITSTTWGDEEANLNRNLSALYVNCSLTSSSLINGKFGSVVHNFLPTDELPYSRYVEKPPQPYQCFLDPGIERIEAIHIWITDNSGDTVDLQNLQTSFGFQIYKVQPSTST